jgi:hypothetical protein
MRVVVVVGMALTALHAALPRTTAPQRQPAPGVGTGKR